MQLAESMASSTEPAWLRQPETSGRERKPRSLKTSPSHALNANMSPVVVDLDRSGSEEDIQQNLSHGFVDLTADPSPQQDSESADAAAADVSVGELMDKSETCLDKSAETSQAAESWGHEDRLLHVTAGDKEELNGSSVSEMDQNVPPPSENRRLSVLQQSSCSLRAEPSRTGSELDSLHGDFNLQLEDSRDDALEDVETEEEEQKLLSQLQMDGSFNASKSLSESLRRQTISSCQETDVDESIVVARRKRAAVIYDSEEEEEEEEERQPKSQLNSSFQVLGASTPKSASSGSPPHRSRRSLGGNASVVSRRSFLQSIIEDMDDLEDDGGDAARSDEENGIFLSCNEFQPEKNGGEEEEEEEGEDSDIKSVLEDEEEMEPEDDVSEMYSDEVEEEEEVIGSTGDALQLEETKEEDGEEDSGNITPAEDEKFIQEESKETEEEQDMSVSLEESTGDPELASGEKMDRCTVEAGPEPSYEALVRRGRECYSQAKLDQALDFFLRAIDIRPGDPEVQFMTIQLYRQLSQRR